MKRSELAILLVLALIALAILGCWYVNMKYNEGQRKYSTLQAKYGQLEKDHAEQTKTLAASRVETAETQQSLDETLSSKDALQTKFNVLKTDMQKKLDETQPNKDALQTKFNILQDEHARLVANKTSLQNSYDSLNTQKEQLESQIKEKNQPRFTIDGYQTEKELADALNRIPALMMANSELRGQLTKKQANYLRINTAYAAYIRYVHSVATGNANHSPADAGVSGPDGGW